MNILRERIVNTMSDISAERTPIVIAAEINMIKDQTERMALNNFIEIGRRLKEAKAMLPYGEWGKWLEESVSFSQSRADKLMRVYDAYGTDPPAALNAGAQLLPELSYTQALILLGVPEEERVQLIADWDIETMSVRELQKAVKERDQAKQDQERAEEKNAGLREALDTEKSKNSELTMEREGLKTKVDELEKSKQGLEQAVEQKVFKIKKLEEDANVKSYNRVNNQLLAIQIRLLTSNVAYKYDGLKKAYEELMVELGLLANIDQQVHGEYAKKVNDFLNRAVRGRMGH